MLTNDELKEVRKILTWLDPLMAEITPAATGERVHPQWDMAKTVNAVGMIIGRVPRLLDEIERLQERERSSILPEVGTLVD